MRPGQDKRLRAAARERGVSLIIVVVAIAILTAVATEFAYNSRVDLQLATNQRDEVRAYFLARSGIGLSRLLLRFQKQVDNIQIPNLSDIFKALSGSTGSTAPAGTGALGATSPTGTGAPGAAPSTGLNIQLWKLARIDCQMLQMMVRQQPFGTEKAPVKTTSSGGTDDPEVAARMARRSFGGFNGCFLATIGDEEEKLNVNKLNALQLTSQAAVARLLDLLADKRFEFVFDREDANRVKVTPQDVVIAMRDWIDEDDTQSALNLTGQGDPFSKGFSDENSLYDRYIPRYKAKNAVMDTLDELYMVNGVSDRFMAAFKDRLTVYTDINSKLNINTDDPLLLRVAILAMADPAKAPAQLADPYFMEDLIRRIRAARVMPGMGMSVNDFASLLQLAGVPVNPLIKANVQGNRFVSDKTSTYSIKSVGEAGSVQKTIEAVIRMDDQGLGRLVYWRED
jgi:general secretion pathway protein K